jgi:exonuclease SbcC
LEITNFQCYSNSSLSFDFSSALIVGERDNNSEISNGAGKSALFEAVAWALFGKSRQRNADGVVKRGTDFCEVDFLFEHNSKRYRVIRKRNARFSKIEVLFFEVLSDGTERAIQSDTNREADAKIREVLKSNYDVFLNSSYFMQNTISDFLNGTPSERQKIVSSILNLERWNNYQKEAKKEFDEYSKLAGQIEYKLKGFETVEEDLVKAEDQLKEAQTKARQLNSKESQVTKEITELEARAANLKLQETTLNDYHDIVSKLDNVNARVKELTSSVSEKEEEVKKLDKKIEDNKDAIEQLEEKVNEISGQVDLRKEIDLQTLEKELVDKKTQRRWYVQQVDDWDGEAVCQCCGNFWHMHEEKVAEYEENKAKCAELGEAVEKLEIKVATAKEVLDKVKQTELEIEKYTGRKKSLENNNEIHSLKREVAQKEHISFMKSLEEAREKQVHLTDSLKGMDEIVASDTYEKVRTLLKSKKEDKERIADEKNDISYLVGGLTQKVDELERNKKEKEELNEELEKCQKSATIFNHLIRAFSRNGIQAIIIDNVIEELTKVANKWLNEFCYEPTYVRFITQKKDSKGGWKETLDIEVITPSGICDFESLSGAFAIRLALSQIQSRRMGGESQLLLLDEVSTSLDRHGLEMFMAIIRKLEKTIKVMVVTHDDKLKDEFDNIISVKKVGSDSFLTIS